MSTNATFIRRFDDLRIVAAAAVNAGDLWQMPSGQPGIIGGLPGVGYSSGDTLGVYGANQWTLPKTTSMVLLDGGRAYWDRSAGTVSFRKVNDRDFYIGRVVGDAASTDTTCAVNIGIDPPYDLDIARDAFRSVLIGTQAVGGFGGPFRYGGANKFLLSSTNEAQKVDALTKDGFATGANAIIEAAIDVVSLGSGSAPRFSIGIASGTHATDALSITQRLLFRINGNSNILYAASGDGTTTVAATDTTKTVTAGTRYELWIDTRNPANPALYVDGVRVLSGTTFNVNAAASTWYLLAHLVKTAAADTFEVDVDWCRARFAEQ